jgi:hypothetical protein
MYSIPEIKEMLGSPNPNRIDLYLYTSLILLLTSVNYAGDIQVTLRKLEALERKYKQP